MAVRSYINTKHWFPGLILSLFFLESALAQTPSDVSRVATDAGLGGQNSIYGTVILPSGQRMERRIRVRLITETRGDRTFSTDSEGRFIFSGLVSGRYVVVIDGEAEFEPFRQEVSIYQFRGSPPQEYPINIRLALKGTATPKPGTVNAELAGVPKSALEFYAKAQEFAKNGDNKAAIENLQLAITDYPEFSLAFNDLGALYLRSNQMDKAEEAFRSALKVNEKAFEPRLNLGIVLVNTERYSEAEPTLRAALKQKDQSAVAHYFLGRSLANLGRFDEAEKALAKCVKLGGDEMKEAHRLLAIIYTVEGKKKQAADELETYLRLVPETPDAEQLRLSIQRLRGAESESPANPATTKPSP